MVAVNELSPLELCDRVKKLGYGKGNAIHMYGEKLEVLSDPFPLDGGIAVNVRIRGESVVRVIKLPATVLQTVKKDNRVPASA